jgi:hypothetical protein
MRGKPGCGPNVQGRWDGGVPGRWGRGLVAKAAGPMGRTRRRAGTRGVPGCRAEACRPDGVNGVVVGGSFLTCRHDGPEVTVQRWPCCGALLVVSSAEGATRRSVTVCRDRPAPQPLREQEQIRAVMWQSQGVSIGAPTVLQSEDWIANIRRRVVSQAGVFTRAYPRNAATGWSCERALLHRIPNGVMRGIATIQQAPLSTLLVCSNRQPITDLIQLDNHPPSR